MERKRLHLLALPSAFLLTLTACSNGAHAPGSAMIPSASERVAAPLAKATPPVTAPVTIPYPYTSSSITKTWTSATSQPKISKSVDNGTTTVKFQVDKKTGVYFVPETIVSKAGYTEVLNSAIGFQAPPSGGGIGQIIFSDNYTYTQGAFVQTGMDTYPDGQNSFDFPLTTRRKWSAAAAHNSFYNEGAPGSGAFQENVTTNVAADGTYTGQTSFSSTNGSANQDNYASTVNVRLGAPSIYTLAEPAAGFNPMTQTFALPMGGKIAVATSGTKPIPGKAGTVSIKDWYPGTGVLPRPLYRDNYLVTGTVSMPSSCGKRSGQSATHIFENFASLDPVAGTYDTYTTDYYMAPLAKGQYWFACIVENFTSTTYANGWFMGSGSWGGISSQTTGSETLIASGATPGVQAAAALPQLHVFAFVPPAALHAHLASLHLRAP